jgi:hypothetical protein
MPPVRSAQARSARYAARQAYERASVAADRLARRVRELSERVDRAAELEVTPPRTCVLIQGYEQAPARMVVVSTAMRARARVGPWPGDRRV